VSPPAARSGSQVPPPAAWRKSPGLQASVVVPFYERQDQLDRLLAGLDLQTLPPSSFEVVIADDGSSVEPRVGDRDFATTVVRQSDEGFRLAAARNLGSTAAVGDVLVFLDQDCVPAPDYLEKVLSVTTTPWDLTVGHRLHADLDGWTGEAVRGWLRGDGEPPELLDEPEWLLDGYERTADLTRPDDRAYQLVIGAVTSISRHLHEELGGFDETFRAYGGEDWDYGHRAVVAGAEMRWLADAVVWHDGPDLPGRGDLTSTKNAETIALARRLPDPDVRGTHLVWSIPEVVVRVDTRGAGDAAVIASLESLLAGTDAHVWLGDGVESPVEDPRVHAGRPGPDVMARARWLVDCAAVLLHGTTLRELTRGGPVGSPDLQICSTRDAARQSRGVEPVRPRSLPVGVRVERLVETPVLERHWQSRTTR
jgi:GT2 family glycosyltransferase